MEKRTPTLVVFGSAGRGKSTILNYIFQDRDEIEDDPIFITSGGGQSCTIEAKIFEDFIKGTQQKIRVIDIPGMWANDKNLEKWKKSIEDLHYERFDYLAWVINVKERVTSCDGATLSMFKHMFENYQNTKIILVMTHCDCLERDDLLLRDNNNNKYILDSKGKKILKTVQDVVGEWVSTLNDNIKDRIESERIVYFGKKVSDYFQNISFREDLIKIVEKYESENYSFKDFDALKAMKEVSYQLAPEAFKEFNDEFERLKKEHEENQPVMVKTFRKCIPGNFTAKMVINNKTKESISNIQIEHKINKDKEKHLAACFSIPLLEKNKRTNELELEFGTDKPSTAVNIILCATLIGTAIAGDRGWGKDYWSIFCEIDGKNYKTDGAEKWNADIWEEDSKDIIDMNIRKNTKKGTYFVEISRNKNRTSTRDLDPY